MLAITVIGWLSLPCLAQQSPPDLPARLSFRQQMFAGAVRRARTLEKATYKAGYGMAPGEFYHLTRECLRYGSAEDLRRLLKDEKAIVRVLGLICLAQVVERDEFAAIVRGMKDDRGRVIYTNGCILDVEGSVGEIAESLAEGRFFVMPEYGW